MVKQKVYIKINPYLKRVKTKYGKKQRVIRGHKRLIIRDFDRSQGKEELAKEFFVRHFERSPEQNLKEFHKWKESLDKEHPKPKIYKSPILVRARIPKSVMENYDSEYDDDVEEQIRQEDRKKEVYGLPPKWMGLGEEGESRILKEKSGLALIMHHDPLSPSSEHPTTYEVREKGGKPLWDSGITYMAEFIHEGLGTESVSPDLRKEAEEKFKDILKKKKSSSGDQKNLGSLKYLPRGRQKGLSIMNQQFLEEIRSTKNKKQLNQVQEEVLFSHLTPKQKSSLIRIGEAREDLRFPRMKNLGSFVIYDPQEEKVVGRASTYKRASNKRDKLDNEYGGYKYRVIDEERLKGIKKLPIKNTFSSSPTTGTTKPSDSLLFESIQGNKRLKQKSDIKKKFGIDLGDIEDLESK